MKTQLAELGISTDDILEKLVVKLCAEMLEDESGYATKFQNRLEEGVKGHVDKVLDKALTDHILPKITEMTEGLCLQETNRWGEKKGTKLTFIEYLTQRADAYLREEVDYNGKTKGPDSFLWAAKGTRISYLIHEHLDYSIKRAMEQALGEVNSSVRKGLEEAVKLAIASVKVKVETKITDR